MRLIEQCEYLSRNEAAEYMGVSAKWLASNGRYAVPSYKYAGRVKYRRVELDEWVKQQKTTRP